MKKIIVMLGILVVVSESGFAASNKEHNVAIAAMSNGVDALVYWNAMSTNEWSRSVAQRVSNLFVKEGKWQELYDFTSDHSDIGLMGRRMTAMAKLGLFEQAESEIITMIASPPSGTTLDLNRSFRAGLSKYVKEIRPNIVGSNLTNEQVANTLIVALKLPVDKLADDIKRCVKAFQKYGVYATTMSPSELYTFLENNNKPTISNRKSATWWAINVYSKVN